MAKLIIKREKAFAGMALAMDCYVNDIVVCKVKNGQEEECYVEDALLDFKCGLPHNPMSKIVALMHVMLPL